MPAQTGPSPILFFETVSAYQRSEAIKAAIELNLFTTIAAGHETAPAIAQNCAVAERGARILCDYLTVLGFLTQTRVTNSRPTRPCFSTAARRLTSAARLNSCSRQC